MTKTPDGMHVVDIWESREEFDKFNEQRQADHTAGHDERGISLDGPPPSPHSRKDSTSYGVASEPRTRAAQALP